MAEDVRVSGPAKLIPPAIVDLPRCARCGEPFKPRRRSSRFCSHTCANRTTTESRRSFSGADNPRWDGGRVDHPLYDTYNNMLGRCSNPDHPRFADYGGRGITVCDRWRDDFWAFVADLGERPEAMWMDRIDNDGNYEPGNVRWTDYSTSARNRRTAGHLKRTRNEKGQFV